MLLVVLKEKSVLTLLQRPFHMPPARRPAMIEAMKQMLSVLAAAPPEALVHPTNAACDLLSRHDADAVFGPTPVQPGRPRGAALEIHAQPSISTTCAFYLYSYPKGSKVAPTPEETGMELFADATVASEDFNTLAKDANYSYEPVKGVGDSAVFRTDRTEGLTLVALSGSEVLTITLVRSGQIPNPAQREPEMIEAMKLMLSRAALAVPTASDEAAPGLHRRAAQQP